VEEIPFRERAQTKYEGNVRVTAAVPSAEESKRLFGVDIYKRGVQPIWLEIENKDEAPVYFLPIGLDPNYFSPIEAAYVNHFGFKTPANEEMNRFFYEQRKDIRIAPANVRSGFVYTPVDEGTKAFNVDLMGEDKEIRTFTFFIDVPGIRPDHQQVDFEALYSKDQIVSYDKEGLRKALENIPCCTKNKKGTEQGDPLNLVVIGDGDDVHHSLIRAGWDETEIIYRASAWKTGMSFIFGGRYRYSPVSPLYVYGRRQDAAFQKARGTIRYWCKVYNEDNSNPQDRSGRGRNQRLSDPGLVVFAGACGSGLCKRCWPCTHFGATRQSHRRSLLHGRLSSRVVGVQ
jgi:hypothetical protein